MVHIIPQCSSKTRALPPDPQALEEEAVESPETNTMLREEERPQEDDAMQYDADGDTARGEPHNNGEGDSRNGPGAVDKRPVIEHLTYGDFISFSEAQVGGAW